MTGRGCPVGLTGRGGEAVSKLVNASGLVGRFAALELSDGTRLTGLVYAVDPETGNVVLCTPVDDSGGGGGSVHCVRATAVFAHAIRSVRELAESDSAGLGDMDLVRVAEPSVGAAAGPRADEPSGAQARDRLRRLCALLGAHRVPFTTTGETGPGDALPSVEAFGSLRIEPPYTASTCACENELVLRRVQALLRQLDPETRSSAPVTTSATARVQLESAPDGVRVRVRIRRPSQLK
ncbi:hypothetical protein T492DRAFT_950104 [Pavlovales sp. CCMP2436]|nr:hypothetical protein T492DRAFT_950104 [Pavlovales sp. CCMP2436]|mmetsp:Transcript_1376/g.3555  ORF Transcript_1376/g.3555 Transcript_1376/m.3555 type:complete len:237 (+) Transcript_1376:50-760(+)